MVMTQQITKDLRVSETELLRKIAKNNEKLSKYKEKCAKLSKENSRLRQSNKEKQASNEHLRTKNQVKTDKIKYLGRLDRGYSKPAGHQYPSMLIELSVLLRVSTGISYRNISTIFGILQGFFDFPESAVPSANTIQNWTDKVGYNLLEKGDKSFLGTEVVAIVDESFQVGNIKMLLILLTPLEKLTTKGLCFSDVRIGYIGYSKSWIAPKIAAALAETVEKFDLKLAYVLGDEASNIVKSASLAGVAHVPDISHAIGTCISNTYGEKDAYTTFVKLISSYQCKGVNQPLSYLIPPNQRTKARFMNQHAMVDWATTVIAKFEELNEKEKVFFEALPAHKNMVKSLYYCLENAQKVSLWLKEEGFSVEMYDRIMLYLSDFSVFDDYHQEFIIHLKSYLESYKQSFTQIFLQEETIDITTEIVVEKELKQDASPCDKRINVCSDVIESIFGKYKRMISNNKFAGVSYIALELPLFTISLNQLRKEIIPAIEAIKMSKIKRWKDTYNIENQATKRKDFFKT